jgi:REP element-mobilizing transposase RayT
MRKEKYVNKKEVLDFGNIYHIYNRAIGKEKLFITNADYFFFLKKLDRFILPIAQIYSYCLIPNHFHLLVKIKSEYEFPEKRSIKYHESSVKKINQPFNNFFNSYAKSFNAVHKRTGRLFLQPYKRIKVSSEDYIKILVNYIHRNPIHHGMTNNFMDWTYSSFNAFLSEKETKINREEVLSYFGTIEDFIKFHNENKSKDEDDKYFLE